MIQTWWLRLLGRAVAYGVVGLIVCGTVGGSLGYLVGSFFHLGMGGFLGGAIGVLCGGLVGTLSFFVAAFFSDPSRFGTTLGRLVSHAALWMTFGAAVIAIPILIFIRAAGDFLFGINPSEYLGMGLIGAPPLLMVIGLIFGVTQGAKRRWNERDQWRSEVLSRALRWGLGFALFCGVALVGRNVYAKTDYFWDFMMPYFGAVISAAVVIPLFGVLLFQIMPELIWKERGRELTERAQMLGTKVSTIALVLLTAAFIFQSSRWRTDLEDVAFPQLESLFKSGALDLTDAVLSAPMWLTVLSLVVTLLSLPFVRRSKRSEVTPVELDLAHGSLSGN